MIVQLDRINLDAPFELSVGANADKTAVLFRVNDLIWGHTIPVRLTRRETEWLIEHLQESLAKLSPPEKLEEKS